MGAGPKVIARYPLCHDGHLEEAGSRIPAPILAPNNLNGTARTGGPFRIGGRPSWHSEERLESKSDHHDADRCQEEVDDLAEDVQSPPANDGHDPLGSPQGRPDDPKIDQEGRDGEPEALTVQKDHGG